MTNKEFQKELDRLYSNNLLTTTREFRTLNELVFALRMSGENYQLNTTNLDKPNSFMCIPGVQDTFIPVKDLAKSVVEVEFDEETYNDFNIKLLLVKVKD